MEEELLIYVFYDIQNDKVRLRVGERCKDYGLQRIQNSAFSGALPSRQRDKLFNEINLIIGDSSARLVFQPVCSKCERTGHVISNLKEGEEVIKFDGIWPPSSDK